MPQGGPGPTLVGDPPENPSGSPLHSTSTRHDFGGEVKNITTIMISKTLNTDVGFCGTNLVFKAKDVSASSFNAAGDMILLYSGLYSNIIKMIGRWISNKMLMYLHI